MPQRSSIPVLDPRSAEYSRDYNNGWRCSERGYSEGVTERADQRNVSDAWWDGYSDSQAGRPKWSYRAAHRLGYDAVEDYMAALAEGTIISRATGGHA